MKEIIEDDVLRFTRAIPVPGKGPWEVALLCEVDKGGMVSFRGESWTVEAVSEGEFCGAPVYQARLVRVLSPPAPERVRVESGPMPMAEAGKAWNIQRTPREVQEIESLNAAGFAGSSPQCPVIAPEMHAGAVLSRRDGEDSRDGVRCVCGADNISALKS